MNWANYHGHCQYCDGKGSPADYVAAAIDKRMSAIGFSSHAPVPFYSFWNMAADNLPHYLDEISELKVRFAGEIDVLLSLEIDYVENVMGPSDEKFKNIGLDYTIGSVHFMGQMDHGEQWAIDGSFESFQNGLRDIYDGNIKAAVIDFFRLQRDMVNKHRPSIIGHFDKIKMHNVVAEQFDEKEKWYLDEVRNLLETVRDCGTIVEINTKSLSRNGLLFPGKEHFEWLRELKIPVVINSDAHYPEHLDAGFREVATLLLQCGIDELAYHQNGNWSLRRFSSGGMMP